MLFAEVAGVLTTNIQLFTWSPSKDNAGKNFRLYMADSNASALQYPSYQFALKRRESVGSKTALTWRPGCRSGQWHPTSGPHQVLGAILRLGAGFGRSVQYLPEYSSFDRELVSAVVLRMAFDE
jgi:hypothetical protein